MVRVPGHVRATPPTAKGKNWTAWYRPANRQRDLPHGTGTKAMDAFLMSDRIQDVSTSAAKDVETDAKELAAAEGLIESGKYVNAFDVEETVVAVDGDHPNPRRGARVTNDAGDPETGFSEAATIEFGNSKVEGRRIMRRAGAKYDSPKGGAPE